MTESNPEGDMQFSSVETHSLIDQICKSLTEDILEGKLKDGDRLKEIELKKRFKVSQSPIREALRVLQNKGLVTLIPRRGAFVNDVTFEKVEQNFAVRAVLEGLAAREAFIRITEDDLSDLKELIQEMTLASSGEESETVMKCMYQFHRFFILKSENDVLINCLRNLPVHFMWKRFVLAYSREEMEELAKIHEGILEAFADRGRSPDKVERMVRRQLHDLGAEYSARAFAASFAENEPREGMEAFLEKRRPDYN